MGLVRKQRAKRIYHKKRWDKAVILEEKEIVKSYAMKNKKEIRKFEKLLKNIKEQAKKYNREITIEGNTEEAEQFIKNLYKKGFLKVENAGLDDVLSISLRDILDRRLTSLVYKKKLARTPKQARQLIVHGHIAIDSQKVNTPNLLVSLELEPTIDYHKNSPLFNEDHPLRKEEFKEVVEEQEDIKSSPKRDSLEYLESFDKKEEILDNEEIDEKKEKEVVKNE